MSDSEAENAFARPSDRVMERELRRQVVQLMQQEGTSINSIRAAAERALKLPEGFFKDNATWKAKSKAVVNDQIDRGNELPPSLENSPPPKATKRSSPDDDDVAPRKKRKGHTRIDSDEEESEFSEPGDVFEEGSRPRKSAPKSKGSSSTTKKSGSKSQKQSRPNNMKTEPGQQKQSKTEESTSLSSAPEDLEEPEPIAEPKDAADSESDLSSVIDEEPKPKKQRKGAEVSASRRKKKTATSKGKDADLTPDEAEIRRLQGWLVKCGIRKLWGKELKPYGTPKAKIQHLKQMLEDVGMTGRFSIEKANQIKEARELAADIEAVKEGNERWGMEGASDEEDARPKRRLVRGHKNFDFLSSGGEETD